MQKETWLQLVLLIYHSILSKAASVQQDRKSTRPNSSNGYISYAVFCLKKKRQSLNGCWRGSSRDGLRPTLSTPTHTVGGARTYTARPPQRQPSASWPRAFTRLCTRRCR